MAQGRVKITELPSGPPVLTNTDVFPLVQSHTDYQTNLLNLQNFFGIYSGSGAPTLSAPNGSIYLRSDSTAAAVLYVRAMDAWAILQTPPLEVIPGSGSSTSSPSDGSAVGKNILFDSTDSLLSIIGYDASAGDSTPFIIGDFT